MHLENFRHYLMVSLLVFGCAIFYTLLIVWALKNNALDGVVLKFAYVAVYIRIVFFGLRFYIPRLRGIV